MDADGGIQAEAAAGLPGEHALDGVLVEDDDVEVEVRVEGGAEAVQEGDGAEPGIAWSGRAGASERGADGAQQDAQHAASEAPPSDAMMLRTMPFSALLSIQSLKSCSRQLAQFPGRSV